MNPKIKEIVATLREYAPDEDGTQRYILIPAAERGAIAEYPVTVRSHRTDIMREAADLIEQLQQELIDERYRHDRYADFCVAQGEELSKLKEQQRWIPVTEPPKEDEQVFAFCYGQVFVAYYHSGLGFISDETGHRLYGITHWMPLPERPKEE